MIIKQKTSDVKSFSFGNLSEPMADSSEAFIFKNLSDIKPEIEKAHQEIIRKERQYEAKHDFKIDQIVKDCRGLTSQEQNDLEQKISLEVNKRIAILSDKAYKDGIEKGRMEGADSALKEALLLHQDQIDQFQAMIEKVQADIPAIMLDHQQQSYEMIKRVLKWLVIKEVNDESYLPNLLEKLILELNQRQNLIIRVRKESFEGMPQVVAKIEEKLGKLSNLRLEIDMDQTHPGIILETENGILDGTTDALFQTLDKMFEEVSNHDHK